MPLVIFFLWLLLSQLYHANIQLPSVIQCILYQAQFRSLSNGLPGHDFFFNLYLDCTASDQTSYQRPLYRSAIFNWCEIVFLASSETQMSAWFCFPRLLSLPLCGKTQLPVRTLWFKRVPRYPVWTLPLLLPFPLPGKLLPSMGPADRLCCKLIFAVIPHYLASRSVIMK